MKVSILDGVYGNMATNESESASDARSVIAPNESVDSATDVTSNVKGVSRPRYSVPRVDGIAYSRRGRIKLAEVKQVEDVSFEHVAKVVLSQLVYSLVKDGLISSEQASRLTNTPLWTNIILLGVDEDETNNIVRKALKRRQGKHTRSVSAYLFARYRSLTKDNLRARAIKKLLPTMHSKKISSAKNLHRKMHRKTNFEPKSFVPQGWEWVSKIATKISNKLDPIAEMFKDLTGKITTAIGAFFSRSKEAIKSAIEMLQDSFSHYRDLVFDKIKEVLQNLLSKVLVGTYAVALGALLASPFVAIIGLHIIAFRNFRESVARGETSVLWGLAWLITSMVIGPLWIIELVFILKAPKDQSDLEVQSYEDLLETFATSSKEIITATIKFFSKITDGTSKLLLVDRFVDLITKYFKLAYHVATGHAWDDRMHLSLIQEITKFSDDSLEAISAFQRDKTLDTAQAVIALEQIGHEIERKALARKLPALRLNSFMECRARLSSELSEAKKFVISSATVPKPVGIYILGKPGTGKDTLVDMITRNYDFPTKLVWPIKESFVESFADQKTIIIQDFGQNRDKAVLTEHMDVVRCLIENTPQPVPRAFGAKGTSFSAPHYVFVTTNHEVPISADSCNMADVGAFYRRFEIFVQLEDDKSHSSGISAHYNIWPLQIKEGKFVKITEKPLNIVQLVYMIKSIRKLNVEVWQSTVSYKPPSLPASEPNLDALIKGMLEHRGTDKYYHHRDIASSSETVDLSSPVISRQLPDTVIASEVVEILYHKYIQNESLEDIKEWLSTQNAPNGDDAKKVRHILNELVQFEKSSPRPDTSELRRTRFAQFFMLLDDGLKSVFDPVFAPRYINNYVDFVPQMKVFRVKPGASEYYAMWREFEELVRNGSSLDDLRDWFSDLTNDNIVSPLPERLIYHKMLLVMELIAYSDPELSRLDILITARELWDENYESILKLARLGNHLNGFVPRRNDGMHPNDYVSDSDSEPADTDSDDEFEAQYWGFSSVSAPELYITFSHAGRTYFVNRSAFESAWQQNRVRELFESKAESEKELVDFANVESLKRGKKDVSYETMRQYFERVGLPPYILPDVFWAGKTELDYEDYVELSVTYGGDEQMARHYKYFNIMWDALKALGVLAGVAALATACYSFWPNKKDILVESEDWRKKREKPPPKKRVAMKMKKILQTPVVTPQGLTVSIINRVMKQSVELEVYMPDHALRMVKALFVTDKLLLFTSHVMRENMDNLLSPMLQPNLIKIKADESYVFDEFELVETENDCAFIKLPKAVPGMMDISSHFISNEVELDPTTPVVLVIKRDGVLTTGNVTNVINDTIKSWPVEGTFLSGTCTLTTLSGDCGSVYFTAGKSSWIDTKIIGIHTGIQSSKPSKKYISSLSYEEVKEVKVLAGLTSAPEISIQSKLLEAGFNILGKEPISYRPPQKHKLQKTPIHGLFVESNMAPAMLVPENGVYPLYNAISDWKRQPIDPVPYARQESLLDIAVVEHKSPSIRPLTADQAVNGDGNRFKGLDLNTAAGYGAKNKKKADFFEKHFFTNGTFKKYEPKLELIEQTLSFAQALAEDRQPDTANVISLKVECRKKEKVITGQTRAFCVSPLAMVIIGRMIHGPVLQDYIEDPLASTSSVGMNVHGMDPSDFMKIRPFTDHIMPIDYRRHDKSVNPIHGTLIGEANGIVYSRAWGEHIELDFWGTKLKVETAKFVRNYHNFVTRGPCVFVNIRAEPVYHIPSGDYITAKLNREHNEMLHTDWLLENKVMVEKRDYDPKIHGCSFYGEYAHAVKKSVLSESYHGDDVFNMLKARELARILNCITFAEFAKKRGLTVTPAGKSGEHVPFVPLSEATYLKRVFVQDGPVWRARRSIPEILEMFNWWENTSKSGDELEAWRIEYVRLVDAALTDLHHHGKEIYDIWRQKFVSHYNEEYGGVLNTLDYKAMGERCGVF